MSTENPGVFQLMKKVTVGGILVFSTCENGAISGINRAQKFSVERQIQQ